MSGNYSCFQQTVDLSFSGSKVSPTQKSKPSSARSTTSSSARLSSSLKHRSGRPAAKSKNEIKSSTKQSNNQLKDKSKPSLAMSFPMKENTRPHQSNVSSDVRSSATSEDYLMSIFSQSKSRSRPRSSVSKKQSNVSELTQSNYEEKRVFEIPRSARSDSTINDEIDTYRSTTSDLPGNDVIQLTHRNTGSGDADVDYLKSYLSNVDKYKNPDESTSAENLYENLSSPALSPRVSSTRSAAIEHFVEFDNPAGTDHVDGNIRQFQRNHSARRIQKWYRRHSVRRKSSQAAMKRMFQQKKEEMENNTLRESLRSSQRSDEEKKRQREKRAQEARQKAIKDLQEKRKSEKELIKKVAEEEIEIVKRRIDAEKSRSKPSLRVSSVVGKKSGIETPRDEIDSMFETHKKLSKDRVGASKATISSHSENHIEVDGRYEPTKSHTTLDDVLQTIKLLEEEPDQLAKPKSDLDQKLSWIDDLELELQSNVSKTTQKSHVPRTDASSLLTEAKLQSINTFLDQVEKHEPDPIQPKDISQQIIQAEQSATEVTSQMLKLKLDLEEKTRSVSLLQSALVQQQELSSRQSKEQEIENKHRMKMQKDQYESTIQRHLTFIDQLIDDKKLLNEKCEKLVTEMKQVDTKYQKKIKELSNSHQTEMKKTKDILVAAEKLRREKWIDEKTKKIKEMTVKGLEPEIQRLIAKHKEEMKKVKAIQEAELLRSDERAGQRYIRQTEELREQLDREKESACTREREIARQRYEKQLEQEEIALQQQRKRLFAEVAEEKERLSQQATRQRSEIDQLKQQIEGNSRIAASTLRDEFEKSSEDATRRHKEEMKSLHERLNVEKQAWQENYMKKQEAFMMQKERELKESVRRDRDSEIESAISRLEDDMHQQREELDKTTENRIKRIRDKYEAEMREIERSEKQTQDKYNQMKSDHNEIEGENLKLQSLCKQKEQEVADTLKIKNKLVEERGNVTDVIRQEFADRLVITDEENKRMKNELSEMRARQRLELERVNNEKEEELAEVHKRVRQAIIKKEETITQIRHQYDAAVKRADHLEALLEGQRKKLLGKRNPSK